MITQHFILHIVPDEVRPRIYVSQRSSGLEKLQFSMVGANGAYYSIPSGTSVTMVGSKPDRTSFSYACTYSGYTVTCDVTEQMTAVAGVVTAELRFENASGAILPSQNMEIVVERSPVEGMVCSKNDFKAVDDEIISMHQDAVLAKYYAEEAQEACDTAVTDISQLRDSAVSTINTTASSATSNINTKEAEAEDAFEDAVARMQEYAERHVVLEHISSTDSLRITTVDSL